MTFYELMAQAKDRGVKIVEISGGDNPEILRVCEDSRKVQPGDLFVARAGSKADGATYIEDAVARGAVAVVVSAGASLEVWEAVPEKVGCVEVQDVNLACAVLAHEVAGNPTAGMKVIGITGTKGKTTVAYLMRSVLKAAGHVVGMIGTVEIDDGKATVPAEMTTPGAVELVELFSRMKANGVTHCVMEVSSHALHQHRVAGIDFAVAIFTNLTGDHLDYHGTMEEYAAAKAMLFEGLKEDAVALVNADDKWVERVTRGCKGRVVRLRTFDRPTEDSSKARCDWKAVILYLSPMAMMVEISGASFRSTVDTCVLIGKHNASNMLSVFAAACEMGMKPAKVLHAIKFAEAPPGRLQRVDADSKKSLEIAVFVDYAHTHDSLENVLVALRTASQSESAEAQIRGKRIICLFGCGGDRDRTKRPKMAKVAEALADKIIVTSDNPRTEDPHAIIEEICAGFSEGWRAKSSIHVEPDRRAAIRLAIGMARAGDVVLLAGKGHENYQIIGTTKHHFDDVEEAEAALRGGRAGSPVEMAGGVAL